MKNIILLISICTVALTLHSQEIPCAFVGIYDATTNGNSVCRSQTFIIKELKDRKDWDHQKKDFALEHEGLNPYSPYVNSSSFVIVCKWIKVDSKMDCSPSLIRAFWGSSFDACKKLLAEAILEYPETFKNHPEIVDYWSIDGTKPN